MPKAPVDVRAGSENVLFRKHKEGLQGWAVRGAGSRALHSRPRGSADFQPGLRSDRWNENFIPLCIRLKGKLAAFVQVGSDVYKLEPFDFQCSTDPVSTALGRLTSSALLKKPAVPCAESCRHPGPPACSWVQSGEASAGDERAREESWGVSAPPPLGRRPPVARAALPTAPERLGSGNTMSPLLPLMTVPAA